MRKKKTKVAFAWILALVGLILTAMPLYAELFTRERYQSESTESSKDGYSTMTTESYIIMHVSPLLPFCGGLITLVAGILAGRLQVAATQL